MFDILTIARVYAKSIFDLSIEQSKVDYWREILEIFSKISQNICIQSLCFRFISSKKLSEIIINIYESYQNKYIDSFVRNLIFIMSENNRILLFPVILEEFQYFYFIYMNIVKIEVISARKLNNNQIQKISAVMERRLSKKIKLVCSIKKSILAGIIIRIGDTVIDGSLINRVFRLRNNILQF